MTIKKYIVKSYHPNWADEQARNKAEVVEAYNAFDAYWQVAIHFKEENFSKPYVKSIAPYKKQNDRLKIHRSSR